MPQLATRTPAPQPVPDQLSRLPPRVPQLPPELFERFPSLRSYQEAENKWWAQTYQALQISNSEISQHATKTDDADDVLGVLIRIETAEREDADGFLSGKYTLQVIAGDVVTGMEITSSTGPNAGTVSDVTFQADRFQIYSGTTKKVMFVADAGQDKVRMAGVFTVDGGASAIYIKTTAGAGSYNSAGTPFFVDNAGRMSLGTGLVFDGTNLTISGTITANAGSIAGFTISGSDLSVGSGTSKVVLSSSATVGVTLGETSAAGAAVVMAGGAGAIYVRNNSGFGVAELSGGATTGQVLVGSGSSINVVIDGTGIISVTTGYSVGGVQVVGAQGTRGAAGLPQVVALLDSWGAWA